MAKMASFHVGVSAEAFAAGFLAQAGCDVLVQYGANQPDYDLVATGGERMIKISVKGSQDGGWGLIQNYKAEGVSYHEAADRWAAHQSPAIVYCLVQFQNVKLGDCPRVYLATVEEIATWHKASRKGLGGTILYEEHTYIRGEAANITDRIPLAWRFSEKRLGEMLRLCGGEAAGMARLQPSAKDAVVQHGVEPDGRPRPAARGLAPSRWADELDHDIISLS